MEVNKEIDTRGLNCPLPILKAKKAISAVPVGGTLEVLAPDPNTVVDMQAFVAARGHELVEQAQDGDTYRFLLRRGR